MEASKKRIDMKKVTLLSLVAAAVLFTACGEDTKKAVADAAEATKAKAAEVAAAAKAEAEKTAADAAEAAKAKAAEVAAAAKVEAEKAAADAAEATKEAATETVAAVKEAVAPAADNTAGAEAYAKCAGCHGKDGKTKALGKSEVVAGQSAADLTAKMAEYKAGTRNVAGMGMLMKGQVASMSDDDIKAVSEYMSAM